MVGNAYETHLILNMEDWKTIGLRGDQGVKHAEVSAGDEGTNMIVYTSRGKIVPMLIFGNSNQSYDIQGVNDAYGVLYRSLKKWCMDGMIFVELLSDTHVIKFDQYGRNSRCFSILFLDKTHHRKYRML